MALTNEEMGLDEEGQMTPATLAEMHSFKVEFDAARRATGTRVLDEGDEDECPHDEHDHYICLDCGKDIMDDVIAAAELRADSMQDR